MVNAGGSFTTLPLALPTSPRTSYNAAFSARLSAYQLLLTGSACELVLVLAGAGWRMGRPSIRRTVADTSLRTTGKPSTALGPPCTLGQTLMEHGARAWRVGMVDGFGRGRIWWLDCWGDEEECTINSSRCARVYIVESRAKVGAGGERSKIRGGGDRDASTHSATGCAHTPIAQLVELPDYFGRASRRMSERCR